MSGEEHEARLLRSQVLKSLSSQGFVLAKRYKGLGLVARDKTATRDLHKQAVDAAVMRASPGLKRHEGRLLRRFARGRDVDPCRIRPALKLVTAGSDDELLFRYARLHWSVPVSAGYGRRLRYLVYDEHTEKLMGLFGLGDPVFSLGPRDRWIGWSKDERRERLCHVMDAFVLGAVPPFSNLLCGKLIALLATSSQVRDAFATKYGGKTSLISGRQFDGTLAMITTASALGRSSLYNRLKFHQRLVFQSVGYTAGSGEFHFSNGVYHGLSAFADKYCQPTAKHKMWGGGWRSRREVVRSVLPRIGLSRELVYHGVAREVFVAPLGSNSREYLCGRDAVLESGDQTADELSQVFRDRWLIPRADRDKSYLDFEPDQYRIWNGASVD